MRIRHSLSVAACTLVLATSAIAQEPRARPDPQALIAEQKAALAPLAIMDGTWRGEARHVGIDGVPHVVIQTERVGPLLDGAIRVIEGRGYGPDGTTGFNAFGVLSWDVGRQAFNFRTHAMGRSGDYPFRATREGFSWDIPAGPTTIRYTATIKDGTWHEVGDRIAPDGTVTRFFEMTLTRLGDSGWPAANPVPVR